MYDNRYTGVTLFNLIRYGFKVNTYSFFYKENKDRLYAYLLRMTGDRQLALDLVQESFTRYLGRYGTVKIINLCYTQLLAMLPWMYFADKRQRNSILIAAKIQAKIRNSR